MTQLIKDLRKACRSTGAKLKLNLPHYDFLVTFEAAHKNFLPKVDVKPRKTAV